MFTLVKKAVDYLSRDTGDKVKERPQLEEFISPTEFLQIETKEFIGTVTVLTNSDGIINKDIYFQMNKSIEFLKLSVGSTVSGEAFRNSSQEAWQVKRLEHHDYIWGSAENQNGTANKDGMISSRDLSMGIPGMLKQDLFHSLSKKENLKTSSIDVTAINESGIGSFTGKVSGIAADTITVNDDIFFCLSKANSNFKLVLGDWISCKFLNAANKASEAHGLDVTEIVPLRKKIVQGEVTHSYQTHVVINHEIQCPAWLCEELSYMVGDAVTVEILESSQGPLEWRALSIVSLIRPLSHQGLKKPIIKLKYSCPNIESGGIVSKSQQKFSEEEHGVVIAKKLHFPSISLGNCMQLGVHIKNSSQENVTLNRVYFVSGSSECQFSVWDCSVGGVVDGTPVTVARQNFISLRLAFHAKFLGLNKQLCVFDFEKFNITRYVYAAVNDPYHESLGTGVQYNPSWKFRDFKKPASENYILIVRGDRPFRCPAFLPRSLPQAQIPVRLWQQLEDSVSSVGVENKVLQEPLNASNYQEKLTMLLHLEEAQMNIQMIQFAMERVSFFRQGEFLSLIVPGLAEKRPSLLIGDSVMASSPGEGLSALCYEGCIHQVHSTKVLLKFHPSFHENYHSEDYSVTFKFNRTPLRRCHFAIKFAMQQLGPEILFPKKLKIQLPQVAYVDPDIPTPKIMSTYHKIQGPNSVFSGASVLKMKGCKSVGEINNNKNISNDGISNSVSKVDNKDNCICREKDQNNHYSQISCDNVLYNQAKEKSQNNKSVDKYDINREFPDPNMPVIEHKEMLSQNLILRDNDRLRVNNTKKFTPIDKKQPINKDFLQPVYQENVVKNIFSSNEPKAFQFSPTTTSKFDHKVEISSPRVAVVTRLFGVQSPPSSSHSSGSPRDSSLNNSSSDLSMSNRNSSSNWSEDDEAQSLKKTEKVSLNLDTILCDNDKFSEKVCDQLSLIDGEIDYKKQLNKDLFEKNEAVKVLTEENANKLICDNGLINADGLRSPKLETNQVSLTVSDKFGSEKIVHDICSAKTLNGIYKNEKTKDTRQDGCNSNREGNKGYCIPIIPLPNFVNRKTSGYREDSKNLVLKWFNKSLNDEQRVCVRRILEGSTRPIPYVIYGPPGTGKTVTLVEAVLQIFRLVQHSRILIVTPSNSASDLIAERLISSGQLSKDIFVRLNAYQRVEDTIPENLIDYCSTADELGAKVRCRVMVATASTAGQLYNLHLHNGHFTHLLMDEAGQMTEPESCVALGLVNNVSGQIVLAGDPKQLGPVVQSNIAKKYGLQHSLLHRLCSAVLYQPNTDHKMQEGMSLDGNIRWMYEPRLVTQLVRNYRSHPALLTVPSQLFYNNSLKSHATQKSYLKYLFWSELPNESFPLVFHGVVSDNLQEGDSPSWFNPAEAFQSVRYVSSLISFGLKPEEIGVITPYRRQCEKIRKLLSTFNISETVKVGSVEEFQGQERTAIIISTVRSSTQLLEVDLLHSLGFVRCEKRFNVAVTRAKALLVVVGNPFLLSSDPCWRQLLSYALQNKAYRGPELNLELCEKDNDVNHIITE